MQVTSRITPKNEKAITMNINKADHKGALELQKNMGHVRGLIDGLTIAKLHIHEASEDEFMNIWHALMVIHNPTIQQILVTDYTPVNEEFNIVDFDVDNFYELLDSLKNSTSPQLEMLNWVTNDLL